MASEFAEKTQKNQHSDSLPFLSNARLITFGTDRSELISKFKSGELSLKGDNLFRGLSDGMKNTSKVKDILLKMGFDSLKYKIDTNVVYISFSDQNIKIEKIETITTCKGLVRPEFFAESKNLVSP